MQILCTSATAAGAAAKYHTAAATAAALLHAATALELPSSKIDGKWKRL